MNAQELFEHLRLPSPWPLTRELPLDEYGWFYPENKLKLAQLFAAREAQDRPIRTVIELGSWLGNSTRWFAEHAELVIAIDTWRGAGEHAGRPEDAIRLPYLFDQFLSNCSHLRDKIAPLRLSTEQAASLELPQADLIYVDADHEYSAVVRDIMLFFPLLAQKGIICGDDWIYWPSIPRAVTLASQRYGREISRMGNFWWLCQPDEAGVVEEIPTEPVT